MKTITVATANQKVLEPVEFTGKIKAINLLTIEDDNKNKKQVFSLTIDGLPLISVEDRKGNKHKATILRTVPQMVADMDKLISPNMPMEAMYQLVQIYANKREVTLNVSAHEKGAIATVTEFTSEEIKKTKKIGETYAVNNSGFYVDGYLDIEFKEEHRLQAVNTYLNLAKQVEEDFGN